jgi:DNA-binding transcriptional MerR regulator
LATLQTVEDTLRKFDINGTTLATWEQELELNIPIDVNGQKQYSHHHISLFKNIKKHLALGRTIAQIRELVTLPPVSVSKPSSEQQQNTVTAINSTYAASSAELTQTEESTGNKSFASAPKIPALLATQEEASTQTRHGWTETSSQLPLHESPRAALSLTKPTSLASNGSVASMGGSVMTPQALNLVDRLLTDKDQIHKKLVEAEKLNSHLYNVNNLFHRKVKELSALVVNLKANNREEANIKLMDDKAKLHRQLLEAERSRLDHQREQDEMQRQVQQLSQKNEQLESQMSQLCETFDPKVLLGRWQEEATLSEVLFDNFGINVEQTRKLERHISAVPSRVFGNAAIISAQYEYESNPLWRRHETLSIAYQGQQHLKGDLQVDYLLDGVVVARCLYAITASKVPG